MCGRFRWCPTIVKVIGAGRVVALGFPLCVPPTHACAERRSKLGHGDNCRFCWECPLCGTEGGYTCVSWRRPQPFVILRSRRFPVRGLSFSKLGRDHPSPQWGPPQQHLKLIFRVSFHGPGRRRRVARAWVSPELDRSPRDARPPARLARREHPTSRGRRTHTPWTAMGRNPSRACKITGPPPYVNAAINVVLCQSCQRDLP
jgi:hypothetical protein